MRWIKWFAIDWINSTARDELNPDERGTWVDFVCLARFPGSEPGTFKISSWEALARKLNTPLSVILSTRDKCLINRIKVEQNDEGIIVAILNWAKYQATGHDNTLWAKPAKTDNGMSDKRRGEERRREKTIVGVVKGEFTYPEKWNEHIKKSVGVLLSMPVFLLSAQKDAPDFIARIERWAARLGDKDIKEVLAELYKFQEWWAEKPMKRPFSALTNWFWRGK